MNDMNLVLERLRGHRDKRVCTKADLRKLVGFDFAQEVDIRHVQNLLVGTIVRLQLVGGEDAGCFKSIQGLRVCRTELVERLGSIPSSSHERRTLRIVDTLS